jgi:L-iditol 2-dehydrogenase
MRALVFTGPGEMPMQERPDPKPERGQVVVAVRAAGICGSDVHGYLGATGRRRPGVVMGHEAAGDVIAIGPDVTSVKDGDRVALRSILPCGRCERCRRGQPNICTDRRGMGMHFDGAYADQILVPDWLLLALTETVSYEDCALIETLAVAMHAVIR